MLIWLAELCGLAQPVSQLRDHEVGDQTFDVPAVPRNLLDQAGGEVTVERVRRDEQSLDPGQAIVHLRHLQLVVEVADRTQSLDDRRDAVGRAVVDEQPVPGVDAHGGHLRRGLLEHREAFVDAEQRLLRGVVEHRDDDLVVQGGGPGDDVEVAVGHGVERPWADHPADHSRAHATLLIRVTSVIQAGLAARPYQSVPSP